MEKALIFEVGVRPVLCLRSLGRLTLLSEHFL